MSKIIEITDEMVNSGLLTMWQTVDANIPEQTMLAAVFMSMMSKHDPEITFTDGEGKFFKFNHRELNN
jgi:hypothetical protein